MGRNRFGREIKAPAVGWDSFTSRIDQFPLALCLCCLSFGQVVLLRHQSEKAGVGSSAAEHMVSMQEALGSIPSMAKAKKQKRQQGCIASPP
jgi:hypothetical protein